MENLTSGLYRFRSTAMTWDTSYPAHLVSFQTLSKHITWLLCFLFFFHGFFLDSIKTDIGKGRNACKENVCKRVVWSRLVAGRVPEAGNRHLTESKVCLPRASAVYPQKSDKTASCWHIIILQGPELKYECRYILDGIPTQLYLSTPPHARICHCLTARML